jgi:hypothetical protein
MALILILLAGCSEGATHAGPSPSLPSSPTASPSASPSTPVTANGTLARFSQAFNFSLVATRTTDDAEVLSDNENCVWLMAHAPLAVRTGRVEATWTSQSPMAERLTAKVGGIPPEAFLVSSDPQTSPLVFDFDLTSRAVVEEGRKDLFWLELSDPGVAYHQAVAFALTLDYVSAQPPEAILAGCSS